MRRRLITACCLFAACSPLMLAAQTSSTALSPNRKAIVTTIEAALRAAEACDLSALTLHLTPDFYMFDAGTQLEAASIISRLTEAHRSGTQYHWHVIDPAVYVDGNSAWIAYVNDGSVEAPSGVTKRRWLESAFLEKTSGTWKVAFWHSTPVNSKPK